MNELRLYLDRPKSENSGIVLLVTENLPVVMVTNRERSVLMDARVFLMNPRRMLELFELSLLEEELEEGDVVKINRPERAQGSGRKKGTFKINEEMIEDVPRFIDMCGLQPHNRRREDVSMVGGVGSGTTWKGREYDMPSWQSVRSDQYQDSSF